MKNRYPQLGSRMHVRGHVLLIANLVSCAPREKARHEEEIREQHASISAMHAESQGDRYIRDFLT